MSGNELTYDDFMQRLNIQDVLLDAGYHLNKRDGLRYPSYVRTDSNGRRVRGDKFIVTQNGKCCFQPPEQKVYNVISFIKEHPHLFADHKAGMSPDRLVNLVCNRLLCNPVEDRTCRIAEPKRETRPFNMSDYDIQRFDQQDRDSQKKFYPYFKHRGIDLYTQRAFHDHFCLATKHRSDGLSFANLSFPLTVPGKEKIVGFEERGRMRMDGGKTYKGKAEGSNSSEGLWIANLTAEPLTQAKEILWFESAYDAMAEYQISPVRSVFVSTGGTPTERQMRGLLGITPNARHYLGFDKDTAGRQFVVNFRKIASEMGFRNENVQSFHPSGCYKDWNDALLGKKDASLIQQGVCDFDYAKFIREGKEEQSRMKREGTMIQARQRYTTVTFSPHWMQFVIDELPILVLCLCGIGYAGMDDAPLGGVVFILSSVFSLRSLYRFVYMRRIRYHIGSEQLINQRGVFHRSTEYMELFRIVDFHEHRSLMQQLCGLKTVTVFSMDRTTPRLEITGVPYKTDIVSLIRERVEYNKRRKGIYEITNR